MKKKSKQQSALDPKELPRGFSLVELMISMIIGLVILAGVISIFLSSKQAFRTQEGMSQVQESGRFLSDLMFPYIRQAGYLSEPLVQTAPAEWFLPNAESSLDRRALWGMNGDKTTPPEIKAALDVTPAPDTDVIVARYFGQDFEGSTPPKADGQMRSCLQDSEGLRKNEMAESVFFVRAREAASGTDAGLSSLSCRARIYNVAGAGSISIKKNLGTQPLLAGVQDMTILYGIDTDESDDGALTSEQSGLTPNRYLPADAVQNSDWPRVASVRITLTIDGAERTEGATDIGDGTADVQDDFVQDGRIRRTFTTTIHIRNRLRA